MFKRFLKTIAALGAGHGLQTLTQLLLPPAFIAAYGVRGYGEWLALAAAVGYLGTLDFGLQTYVLNELTALYHRGELERFHRVQSVGLRLTLAFALAGTLLASLAFFLPIGGMLKITGSQTAIARAVFWLALQILVAIPLGQVIGIYRTFGQTHRGVMWGNCYRVLLLLVTLGLAFLRAPFWLIAFAQFLTALLALALVLLWLARSQPDVRPRLDHWDRALAFQILKPSSFFGLFILNNFLVYQAPVLMLQRFLGSEVVVAFSVARTLFSFVRQGAALVQQAIAPEITRLDGVGDQEKLVRIYVLFEAILFTGVLIINAGLLLLAPTLLWVWLKRPQLFDLRIFIPVMLVSVLSSVKEYKLYFQYATNNHVKTGVMTFLSYIFMVIAAIPAIKWFGVLGFLGVWLVIEFLQLGFVHSCNTDYFASRKEISIQPAFRLGLVLAALAFSAAFASSFLQSQNYLWQGFTAVLVMLALAGMSYFLFDLRGLLREGRSQILKFRLG
jgi:O-antigen/teichoic acid export membrane protein